MSLTAKNTNYFAREIKLLKITGISFTGGENLPYKIYSWLIFITTYLLYITLCFWELFNKDFDMNDDILIYLPIILICTAKACVISLNRIKFGKLLEKLHKDPFKPNTGRGGRLEEKLIAECVSFTTIQSTTYWTFAALYVLLGMAYCVQSRWRNGSDPSKWQFSYGTLTPINVTYTPNYELILLYQTLTISFIGSQFTTTDLLVAGILCHVSFQFRMLQNCFRTLVERAYHEMILQKETSCSTAIPWVYLKRSLEETINYHVAVIELVKEIEEVFSTSLLSVFLGTLCLLAFEVYHGSTNHDVQLMKNAMEFVSLASQVLFVCYWGEQVYLEAQNISLAAYESNFVGTNLRNQKALVLVMRRSANFVGLTAGKFTCIRLATFAWVMRTSFSAYTMLRSVNE